MKSDHLTGVNNRDPDVVLIGGGIMSATLGVMLKRLKPDCTILVVEALEQVGLESSNVWNNAGTGHAGLCELNYTPLQKDGSVDIAKAVAVNESFETSKHFWGRLVELGIIPDPSDFIQSVAHMSFVEGEENRAYLMKRFQAMASSPLFRGMEFSDDHDLIGSWAPLLVRGRQLNDPIAATRIGCGTDVNFGALTRMLFGHLTSLDGVTLATGTRVSNLNRRPGGGWTVRLRQAAGEGATVSTRFVFIGAGGGALPLLQKSGIPEGRGYGGFPVSGLFLVCRNRAVIERHDAKVYGMAAVGAPPMSVPHLDSRIISNQRSLLFGPYAGFSPKFLKKGSRLDLIKSVKAGNLLPMLAAGRDNMALTRYLIHQCLLRHRNRCDNLRTFYPTARDDDWTLSVAGQRVQIIRKDPERTGRLEFGTEVVAAADGSLAAMLGASPGASTSVSIMLEVLEKCFPREMGSDDWKEELIRLAPAYGTSLAGDPALFYALRATAHQQLKLDPAKPPRAEV